MRHPTLCLLALLLAPCVQAQTAAPAASRRPAPPAREEIRQAAAETRKLFRKELADARSAEEKGRLCDQLLKVAQGEKDPSARHALLELAGDLAAEAGDFNRAAACAHRIGGTWDEDAGALLVTAATACARNLKTPGSAAAFWTQIQGECDRQTAAGDFAGARRLAEAGLGGARSDRAASKAATQLVADLRAVETSAAQLAKAESSGQPAGRLNALRGRHLCLMLDAWEKGLPLLAQGDDAHLRTVAEAETAADANADQLTTAAGLWETAARQESGLAQRRILAHAADLYRTAIPKLGGLAKVKAEGRLRELEAKDEGPAGPMRRGSAAYCGELREQAGVRGTPDELQVAEAKGGVRIHGTAKVDTVQIEGRTCGHFGKVAWLSGRTRAEGAVTAAIATKPDGTHYGMAMVRQNGTLVQHNLPLAANERYTWQLGRVKDEVRMTVLKGREEIGRLSLPAGEFGGAGFTATVRRPGDSADLTFTQQ